MQKQELRLRAKARLAEMKSTEKNQFDLSIQQQLTDFLQKQKVGSIGFYYPMMSEPDLSPLWAKDHPLMQSGDLQVCFPRTDGQNLRFYSSKSFAGWSKSSLGVFEPDPKNAQEVSVSQIEIFLVPGLAFDKQGHRLGRGRGFYDRMLDQSLALKVGVAYSCQLFEMVPVEAFDQKMDVLITENKIITPAEVEIK